MVMSRQKSMTLPCSSSVYTWRSSSTSPVGHREATEECAGLLHLHGQVVVLGADVLGQQVDGLGPPFPNVDLGAEPGLLEVEIVLLSPGLKAFQGLLPLQPLQLLFMLGLVLLSRRLSLLHLV